MLSLPASRFFASSSASPLAVRSFSVPAALCHHGVVHELAQYSTALLLYPALLSSSPVDEDDFFAIKIPSLCQVIICTGEWIRVADENFLSD